MGEPLKAYCETCRMTVSFVTQGRQAQVERDGKAYTFRRQIAVCGKCGAEIPYEPFEETAEVALEEAVANGNGLATPEQIRQLPRQYAIGKRPLSKLLGWGELTYTRLIDGRTPNAEHSAEIIYLLNNPAAYARILEIGREKGLITNVAYEKSRRAVDALLAEHAAEGIAPNDPLKAFAVADRLCALAEGDLTPRMLQTLMRLAQEECVETLGESLFETESIEVDWGYEYPQIAAAYSFADIQAAAERLRDAITAIAEEDEGFETEAIEEVSAAIEPTLEEELPDKKGKKAKKDKKDKKGKKWKKEKKGKKGKREEDVAENAPVTEPEPEPKPTPKLAIKKPAQQLGPLSPAECKLIDNAFNRYKDYLEAGLSRSFR